ncbi:hypothetical protein [Facklamia sp. P12945]|uniref:hypothetical protein n=1 Tax=Facklamia sp. P12945 TaxID=3421950 RepID=UPI003D1725B0
MITIQDRTINQKTQAFSSLEKLETTLITSAESEQHLSNLLKEQTALLVLRDNYEGFLRADFEEGDKTFTITLTDEDFKASINLLGAGHLEVLPAWQKMKKELKAAYNEIAKGLEGDYRFNLVNPAATDEQV